MYINQVEQSQVLKLMKAGKAILTFKSVPTGKHFTYKITRAKDSQDLFFVAILNGPDNHSNYQYMGIWANDQFKVTVKSKVKPTAPSVLAFVYVLKHLYAQDLQNVEIFHAGHCCACGRMLTTPESIKAGIGPECAKRF